MTIVYILFFKLVYANDPSYMNAKDIFYNDYISYKESSKSYISNYTTYRNLKLSEEYRNRIMDLEKSLSQGNKKVLQTVNRFRAKHNDAILLDDVLLMRLAQLEFDRVNYEIANEMSRTGKVSIPDYSKSVLYAKTLIENHPNSQLADSAQYLIAYVAEEQGDFEKAKKIYASFLNSYPYSSLYEEVLWRISELRFETNEIAEARRGYLELAKKVNSKFEFKALYKLGATLYSAGLYDWSSKMFLRLYERLSDDYTSTAERLTLYDETVEYLGLIQIKGINLNLEEEVEAVIAKKLFDTFSRHNLREKSVKVITDFLNKYKNTKHYPSFMSTLISYQESIGNYEVAERFREELLTRLTDSTDWWRFNRDNVQERFIAEQSIEKYIIDSARFLAQNKKTERKAIDRYRYYINAFSFNSNIGQIILELGQIHFNNKSFMAAYQTLSHNPVAEISDSLKDSILYLKFLSYYWHNQGNSRWAKTDKTRLYELVDNYLNYSNINMNKADVVRLSFDILHNHISDDELTSLFSRIDFNSFEYGNEIVIGALNNYISIKRKTNEHQSLVNLRESLQLRKELNISHFLPERAKQVYNRFISSLRSEDIDRAREELEAFKRFANLENYAIFLSALVYRSERNFTKSNKQLAQIKDNRLSNFTKLLIAKNAFDKLNFKKAKDHLVFNNKSFENDYPEISYILYKINSLEKNYAQALVHANDIYKITGSDTYLFETAFRMFAANQINQNTLGVFLKTNPVVHKVLVPIKDCRNEIDCLWRDFHNHISNQNILLAIENLTKLRNRGMSQHFVMGLYKISQLQSANLMNDEVLDFLLSNGRGVLDSLGHPFYASYKRALVLRKGLETHVKLPWDLAYHELIDWAEGEDSLAHLFCIEGNFKECLQFLPDRSQNRLKASLLIMDESLIKSLESDFYVGISYLIGISDRKVANPKLDKYIQVEENLRTGNFGGAFRLSLQNVQNNYNDSYSYIQLFKSAMAIEDFEAASLILNTGIRNTKSDWLSMVGLTYGVTSTVRGSWLVSTWQDIIHNTSKVEGDLVLHDYIRMLNSVWNNKPYQATTMSSFVGYNYLLTNIYPEISRVSENKFFQRIMLPQNQRAVAGEQE